MLVYISLRFLDDDLLARKLSDRTIPARKRRKRSKRQMSYAISAGLYARPQGRFAKTVLYIVQHGRFIAQPTPCTDRSFIASMGRPYGRLVSSFVSLSLQIFIQAGNRCPGVDFGFLFQKVFCVSQRGKSREV